MLLSHASDDFEEPDTVRRLLRDLKEVRMAKLRRGVKVLDAGAGVQMNGVGALEIAESGNFIAGVVDGLRYAATTKNHPFVLAHKIPERLALLENRHAKRGMLRMLRTAMPRARSTTKMMTCYDKIPTVISIHPLIIRHSRLTT